MKESIWYTLGKQAALSVKSALITGTKPIRPRVKGKFFGKAPGSTKTAPHHTSLTRV